MRGATEESTPVAPSATPEKRLTAIGILNPWGELWTPKTFQSVTAAEEYLVAWWRDIPNFDPRLKDFKIVLVEIRALSADDLRLSDGPTAHGNASPSSGPTP